MRLSASSNVYNRGVDKGVRERKTAGTVTVQARRERLHEMQKNHAKAIKGLGIACIALSGVIIFLSIIVIAAMGVLGPFIQDAMVDYYFDYGDGYGSIYGQDGIGSMLLSAHHGWDSLGQSAYYGYYDDYAAYQLIMSVINVILVLEIVAEAVTLAAGIIVLRNHNKPEKLNLVFGWSIAGAVIGFICAGIVQCVLFIIIAVFASSDRKLYRAGMYYAMPTGGVYAAPVAGQPVQPVPPVQVPGQPVPPVQPGQPAAMQPAQPQPQSQPVALVSEEATQPPMPDQAAAAQPALESAAEPAPAVETAEVVEAAEQVQASQPVPDDQAPTVVVDEGAVVSIETDADQASEEK